MVSLFLLSPSFAVDNTTCANAPMTDSPNKIKTEEKLEPGLLKEIKKVLSSHFCRTVTIESVERLSEPERRNRILRIFIQAAPHSVILKQSVKNPKNDDEKEDFKRFARDWAGLEFLSTLQNDSTRPLVPRFYGGSLKYRFVLLEDLGVKHISLVDSLTMDDPDKAEEALVRFMITLGKFHGKSFGKTEQYIEILHHLDPNMKTWKDEIKESITKTKNEMAVLLKDFNIEFTKGLTSEVEQIIKENLAPGPFMAYIHGDICPDNVFDNPEKNALQIIDFEYGSVKSALLDGTYLRMGMPTCWCAKEIPSELIERLEEIYREQLMEKIPLAQNDNVYFKAYTYACAFWALGSLFQIKKVLEKDECANSGPTPDKSLWTPDKNWIRPRIITKLQAFLNIAKKHNHLPHFQYVAEKILSKLKTRWINVTSMDVYPAFEKW